MHASSHLERHVVICRVVPYQHYNNSVANAWVNSTYKGRRRQLYLYHCIEPSEPKYLNLFIER